MSRLIRRGVLDRVPHIDGKQLIPKRSLEELVDGAFVPNVEVVSPDVSSLFGLFRSVAVKHPIHELGGGVGPQPGMKCR